MLFEAKQIKYAGVFLILIKSYYFSGTEKLTPKNFT